MGLSDAVASVVAQHHKQVVIIFGGVYVEGSLVFRKGNCLHTPRVAVASTTQLSEYNSENR